MFGNCTNDLHWVLTQEIKKLMLSYNSLATGHYTQTVHTVCNVSKYFKVNKLEKLMIILNLYSRAAGIWRTNQKLI